jgi:iron-sulfur cluster assembly protein
MLALTEEATAAIQGLVGGRPGAGLRIFSEPPTSDGDQAQFGLSISDGPEPTDEVVEKSGTYVFLDPQVARLVDGRTLDARATEGQKVEFAFVA